MTESKCKVDWCDSEVYAKGWCSKHYYQMKRNGRITPPEREGGALRVCDICGKTSKEDRVSFVTKADKFLCSSHRRQFSRNGCFLERTIYDSNVIEEKETYAEVVCFGKYGDEVGRALIDKEDMHRVSFHKWHITKGYACSSKAGELKGMYLHCFIMGGEKGDLFDHIDRNSLDNRKINLRPCTVQQNSMNQGLSKRNTSGIIGISYSKRDNLWRASLHFKDVCVLRKSFKSELDAIKARLEVEKKYFGEFAPQKHLYSRYGIDRD